MRAERDYYHRQLKSDNPKRGRSSGHDPRVYAEPFVEPIRRVGALRLVQQTGLSYRTLGRITRREVEIIAEDTADRLCIALGMDFYSLDYMDEL